MEIVESNSEACKALLLKDLQPGTTFRLARSTTSVISTEEMFIVNFVPLQYIPKCVTSSVALTNIKTGRLHYLDELREVKLINCTAVINYME